MPLVRAIALVCLCGACSDPGHVEGPLGTFELRTALYRISPIDVFVLLSNGELECGVPLFDDKLDQALAVEELLVGACREGAQHVALRLYDLEDPLAVGEYPGLTLADEGSVTTEMPRAANAFYYGIAEAYLADYDDLARTYLAEEAVLWELGDGGQVTVETDRDGDLSGWFSFPDPSGANVAGEFEAKECTGDTQFLDFVENDPTYYCSEPLQTLLNELL